MQLKNLLPAAVALAASIMTLSADAQMKIGGTAGAPNTDAYLELGNAAGSNKGLLLPRVALTGAGNAAPLSAHVAGMYVYNTATAGSGATAVTPGVYYNNGAGWVSAAATGNTAWQLSGNAGTTAGANFIGTTDNQDLIFKRNNFQAGWLNSAAGNTAFGVGSLPANTTGNGNTAVGYQASSSNTTGFNNTAIGNSALFNNTTGAGNTALGNDASYSNTTGASNTAIGEQVLYLNTTGNNNAAMGSAALATNTIGSSNTAIGSLTLYKNTTGNDNTALGYQASYFNTTGNYNTAIGNSALAANTIGNSNTATGYLALQANTTGAQNTAIGTNALLGNTTGINNTAIGYFSGSNISSGGNNIAIGYNTQVPNATGNNQLRIGNTAITYAGVQVAWTITSDKKLKTNIEESPLGLDFVEDLQPVAYNRYTDSNTAVSPQNEYGFVAQDVKQALDKRGITEQTGILSHDNNTDTYSLRYNDFIPILTKAIQEQQKQIEELKAEVKTLKTIKN
ncbi:MAG: tail fiber domain-containing protein [Chitinophagaceae bacterium]|nr:tail fiber domain-containing protein [Chitinophagaceae bacterium]